MVRDWGCELTLARRKHQCQARVFVWQVAGGSPDRNPHHSCLDILRIFDTLSPIQHSVVLDEYPVILTAFVFFPLCN